MMGFETMNQIQEMIRFLSRSRLTAEDVIDRVGSALDAPSDPVPQPIRPSLKGVDAASLARYPDSGLPYALDLEFSPAAWPSVKELRDAFGDYRQGRTDLEAPVWISFYPPPAGSEWKVVLLANLRPGTGPIDDASVSRIMFRRDPVGGTTA